MKRTPLLTALAAGILLLASCKNENKTGLAIPKDAAFVFHVNPQSLSSKLSWADIKNTTWFKDLYAESKDSFAKKLMDNPEASGVDLGRDFAYFVSKRGRGGYGVLEGAVKDEAAFGAMVKKTQPAASTKKHGDLNVAAVDDGVAVWSGKKFALVSNAHLNAVAPTLPGAARISTDSLTLFAEQTLNGEGGSLFDDDRFADVVNDGSDLHLWMNAGGLYSDLMGMMSMMKVSSLLEGNATAASLNFEDGKIAGRFKQFYGKEMQKAMDKWTFRDIDPAALDRIASKDVIGVMALNMDPAGLKELLKTIGMDGMANAFLGEKNLSLDELLEASKGGMVLALTDLKMKDTVRSVSYDGSTFTTVPHTTSDMSVLFAANVAKRATFDKLQTLAQTDAPKGSIVSQLTNDWFVVGNKPDAVNAFAAGGNTPHPFTEKLKGHSFGLFLDVQRLLKTNFTKEAGANGLLAESAAIWKDVVMVSEDYKDGVATSQLTVNFVDGKTNSLKQLNGYFEKINAVRKANKVAMEKDRSAWRIDTADAAGPMAVPAPPAVVEPNN